MVSWSMKWRDFDRMVDLFREHVPDGEEREAVERTIEWQIGEYKRVQRQAEINRGQRDKKTGKMIPQPAKKPKRNPRRRKQ